MENGKWRMQSARKHRHCSFSIGTSPFQFIGLLNDTTLYWILLNIFSISRLEMDFITGRPWGQVGGAPVSSIC